MDKHANKKHEKRVAKKYKKKLVFKYKSYDMCGHCLSSFLDDDGYISDCQLRYIKGLDSTFGETRVGTSDSDEEYEELKRLVDNK